MDDYLRGDPPAPPADLWQRIAAQLPLSPVSAPADDLGDELADGRRRRVARQRRIAGAIAAAAVVAGLSFVAGRTVAPSNPPVEVAASLQARADQARGMPGSRSGDLVAKDGRVLARVVVEPGGQGYIQTVGLAAPDADHAYQLWILDSGQPISLGLLGRGVNTVAFGTTATTNTLAITVEPVSGSAAATTPPIAVAELR